MSGELSMWVEIPVAILLVLSSLFALTGAIGLVRLKDYFQRMHPPALASTLGAWCVALASIIYFSALKSEPVLHAWLIPIQIGRASFRERVCQYVYISVVAVSSKHKQNYKST